MDDIFYFTPRSVRPAEIKQAAESGGEFSEIKVRGDSVQVWQEDSETLLMSWVPFDLSEAEPSEQAELRAQGIVSAFCISHHKGKIAVIMPMLGHILEQFGGWVGNDDDDFLPRFDLSNITEFEYP